MITLRLFYICVLGAVALTFVYFNRPFTSAILGFNSRMADRLGHKVPVARDLHVAAYDTTRVVTSTILYTIAILSFVAAIYLYQLPPPPQAH